MGTTGLIRIMAITTDRIRTMATITGLHSIGTAGTGITATTVIIGNITGTIKVDLVGLKESIELVREQFRASFFAVRTNGAPRRSAHVIPREQFTCL
jgi:hypothetical protein